DGVRALRAEPEHDLADRLRHLEPGRRDLRRQPLRAAHARARQRRRAAAVSGLARALVARARLHPDVARVLPGARGAYRALVARGLVAALGIRHDVARAPLDS